MDLYSVYRDVNEIFRDDYGAEVSFSFISLSVSVDHCYFLV